MVLNAGVQRLLQVPVGGRLSPECLGKVNGVVGGGRWCSGFLSQRPRPTTQNAFSFQAWLGCHRGSSTHQASSRKTGHSTAKMTMTPIIPLLGSPRLLQVRPLDFCARLCGVCVVSWGVRGVPVGVARWEAAPHAADAAVPSLPGATRPRSRRSVHTVQAKSQMAPCLNPGDKQAAPKSNAVVLWRRESLSWQV